jgi:hypothetical protein
MNHNLCYPLPSHSPFIFPFSFSSAWNSWCTGPGAENQVSSGVSLFFLSINKRSLLVVLSSSFPFSVCLCYDKPGSRRPLYCYSSFLLGCSLLGFVGWISQIWSDHASVSVPNSGNCLSFSVFFFSILAFDLMVLRSVLAEKTCFFYFFLGFIGNPLYIHSVLIYIYLSSVFCVSVFLILLASEIKRLLHI